MCQDFRLGQCTRGEQCSFAHGLQELNEYRSRQVSCMFKTQELGSEYLIVSVNIHKDWSIMKKNLKSKELSIFFSLFIRLL